MDIFAAQSFRVLLAVTLAANCCLPCYTLAYADELDDWGRYEQLREDQPERSGDGQADQGPDFQGVLRHEAPEEASPCSELPPAAGAGRFRPSAHVLVEASYSLADSLIRLSTARAYADESQEVEDVPQEEQEEVAGDAGGLEFAPGVGESDADAADGGAAAEGHGSDDGAAAGAGGDTSSDNGAVNEQSSEPTLELPVDFVPTDIGTYPDWCTDPSANSFIGSDVDYIVETIDSLTELIESGLASRDQTVMYFQAVYAYLFIIDQEGLNSELYGWGTASTIVNMLNTILGWASPQTSDFARLSTVLSALVYGYSGSANNVTFPWDTRLSGTGIAGLLALQWGYGYGGTRVIQRESPAYWLNWIYQYAWTTHTFPGASGQTTEGFAEILWRISYLLYDQSGGRSVGNTAGSLLSDIRKQWGYGYGGTRVIEVNSPAYWLEWLYKYSYATHTFAGESSSTTKGVAEILWRMDSKLWDTNRGRSVGNIAGDLLATLNAVNDRDSRSNAWGYDYSSSGGNYYANSPAGWLNWLYKYSWTTHTFAGDDSQTTKGFSEILWLIDSKLYDTSRGRTVGNVLGDVLSALVSHSALSSKGFSDVLSKLDALSDSVSAVDLSETNKLLGLLTADVASIRDKYVVGDSLSDMFGALVGDLQVPATAAAIDGIKGAMSTAFPFCVPSVVNLVLFGSVVADPQAPCWEFDIVGNLLVVDFSGFEDFAEVCRWTVRLLFAAALLLNTRKFVFGVGGAY